MGDLYMICTNLTQQVQQELKSRIDGVDFVFARGGFLGVQCQATSVVIDFVSGAAQMAGLRQNDRIRRINNIPVVVFEDLRRELAKFAVGEQVVIEFERVSYPNERETLTLPVTLGKRQEIPRDR
jgi:S1-C subfamily serine protease